MLSRTASAIVAGLATLALAGCGSAEPPKPPPPPPPQPPEISVPAFSEDGGASCSKVSGLSNCVPWSQPEPENLPWEQIVAVRDQQVSGFAVGPAYLCGLVPDTSAHAGRPPCGAGPGRDDVRALVHGRPRLGHLGAGPGSGARGVWRPGGDDAEHVDRWPPGRGRSTRG